MKIMENINSNYVNSIIIAVFNILFFGAKNREVFEFHVHCIPSVQLKANMP